MLGISEGRLFRCCDQLVPKKSVWRALSFRQYFRYHRIRYNYEKQQKIRCSNPKCRRALPIKPSKELGRLQHLQRCLRCHHFTCKRCRQTCHAGACDAKASDLPDTRGELDIHPPLSQLAVERGWKLCPSCGHLIEKTGGCSRMRCRCGSYFCFECGSLTEWGDNLGQIRCHCKSFSTQRE